MQAGAASTIHVVHARAHRRDDIGLRMRLRELAQARPRFGYLRLPVMRRREGWVVNKTRVSRPYCEEGLTMRIQRRRKRASHLRVLSPVPTGQHDR